MSDKVEFSPLIADIISANVANLAAMTNRIEDDLRSRLAYAQAELALVRADVSKLNSGVYTPSPGAVEDALWPDPYRVKDYAAGMIKDF